MLQPIDARTRCPIVKSDVEVKNYAPLPSPRHIRILDLYKRPTESLLRGALRTINLDDDQQRYSAISHTWGRGKISARFVLQGITIRIPQSLAKFLKRLRDRTTSFLPVWVHAICIEQGNTMERNQQVALMSAIFARASTVFVWLGGARDNSTRLLNYLNKYFVRYEPGSGVYTGPGSISKSICAFPDVFDSLCAFLERPYWSRCWILQELVLAKHVTLFCGRAMLAYPTAIETLIDVLDYFPWMNQERLFKSSAMFELIFNMRRQK